MTGKESLLFWRLPETVYFSINELVQLIDFKYDWFKDESFEKLRAPNGGFRKSDVLKWMNDNLIHEADIIEQLESAVLDAAVWINCGGWQKAERKLELREVSNKIKYVVPMKTRYLSMLWSAAGCLLGDDYYQRPILGEERDPVYGYYFSPRHNDGLDNLLTFMLIKDDKFVLDNYSSPYTELIMDISSFMINEVYRMKLYYAMEPEEIIDEFNNRRNTEDVMGDVYKLTKTLRSATYKKRGLDSFFADIISAVVMMQIHERYGRFFRRDRNGVFS